MKQIIRKAGCGIAASGLLVMGLLLAGCETGRHGDYTQVTVTNVTDTAGAIYNVDKFRVSDPVAIRFSGSSGDTTLIPEYQETIKEDGTISPPQLGLVVAAGKTPGELQHELQTNYATLFRHLTVTLVSPSRYYYVSGEVRKPGPEPYLGETDIVKAISAAGDFTDFANKKNVRLTRANGQTEIIDVKRILDEPQFDVPVFPGDKIFVKRRFW
jgi:protein involved in polysaccharide export with SLBB domain